MQIFSGISEIGNVTFPLEVQIIQPGIFSVRIFDKNSWVNITMMPDGLEAEISTLELLLHQ